MLKSIKLYFCIIIIFLNACSSVSHDNHNSSQRLSTQQQDKQELIAQNNSVTPLPFKDFKERWNAVADEQQSNLLIQNIAKETNENGTYYTGSLPGNLELRLYPSGDSIQQLDMISHGKSRTDIVTMLQAWSQMITILHPAIQMPDVDGLFNLIGVGPNADLSQLKTSSFVYSGINYQVIPTDDGFVFRAAYANEL